MNESREHFLSLSLSTRRWRKGGESENAEPLLITGAVASRSVKKEDNR